MTKLKSSISVLFLAFLVFPVFLVLLNPGFVLAQDTPSQAIQQEIQSLMQQIIALMNQLIQLKISIAQRQNPQPAIQIPAQIPGQTIVQPQIQSNANSGTAVLTVNATGVTAYVSINNGTQFAYASPITLNNGDKYSVTASSGTGGSNSTSKCNGTASSGGSYVCNISMSNS